MMLFSGIMNAMFFMSMISLMDMAMNPAENAMAESHGDTHSVANNNNNSKHSYYPAYWNFVDHSIIISLILASCKS
jgi:glycerol uptake facilitator-like aquaporin